MKLYYSPGACSLSPHIALQEAGVPYETVLASTSTHKLPDGTDFHTINALGYVPVLELDDGTRMTEGPALVQYIADQAPEKHLAPANGTLARYRLQAWLNFIATELHKNFGPLFHDMGEKAKTESTALLTERLKWVESQLEGKEYLMGDTYSVADIYFFVASNWCRLTRIDISGMPRILALRQRVMARPAVQEALQAEGLRMPPF